MPWFDQLSEQLWRCWAYLSSGRTLAIVVGIGFALLAIFLLIASRTRWGQAKPLTKAVVLSVLAHVWLLMYALGTRETLPQGSPQGRDHNMAVAFQTTELVPLLDDAQSTADETLDESRPAPPQPWEQLVPLADLPKPPDLERLYADELAAPALLPRPQPTPMPALPPVEAVTDGLPTPTPDDESALATNTPLPDIDTVSTIPAESAILPPPTMDDERHSQFDETMLDRAEIQPQLVSVSKDYSSVLPPESQLPEASVLPREYQLRQAPNRLQLAQAYGADADSEAAVAAGLEWLAQSQSDNGGWSAAQYGGGTETRALGEYRHGTGSLADTGITGLALLAFLSAGHTHVDGEHKQTVTAGLQYLLHAQGPTSGDLAGPLQVGHEPGVVNARMYCHGIAALALAEAYAMTRDAFLREPVLRAAQYSIDAQDVRGGGWRYRPGDPGDLSQFGWQAMALSSVQRSGIEVPNDVQRRMLRFLDSCSAGTEGGLARYRPGEGRPSETMTAEALACRLLLNYPLSSRAQQEAQQLILAHRPGVSHDNVYFWYYATLALFQLQDSSWRTWNQALKERLLTTQIPAYRDNPGSWDPDAIWGGYGGRVYSTAMSCLCLEVYYRYLPMYQR